jgi:DnaJ family protein C protein 13
MFSPLVLILGSLQSNLKLDIEIQKITTSAMIENVASYLRKGVSRKMVNVC